MPGIRLRHPTARNGVFIVKHTRAYKYPLFCERCHEFHPRKTYHLELDETGCVIVSEGVFKRLQEIGLAGFEIVNTVKNPPPIRLGIPDVLQLPVRVFSAGRPQEK
jgi:hypothetical protein